MLPLITCEKLKVGFYNRPESVNERKNIKLHRVITRTFVEQQRSHENSHFKLDKRLISILFFSPLLAYLTIWSCDLISITLSHNTQYKTLLKIIVLCRSWLFLLFPLLLHLNSSPERWLYLDATNKFSFNCFRAHSGWESSARAASMMFGQNEFRDGECVASISIKTSRRMGKKEEV